MKKAKNAENVKRVFIQIKMEVVHLMKIVKYHIEEIVYNAKKIIF